jgi:hypothetical protein
VFAATQAVYSWLASVRVGKTCRINKLDSTGGCFILALVNNLG